MDKSAKHHYTIIIISLAICLFLYVDSYFIPTKPTIEKVQDIIEYRTGRWKTGRDYGPRRVYTMKMKDKEYDIPQSLFFALNIDEEIEVEKSVVTGSLQRIGVFKEKEIWVYDAGYLRARVGRIAVPAIILGCLSMLIFFRIIDNVQGRANLTYALFICCLLLLFAHLDWNLF